MRVIEFANQDRLALETLEIHGITGHEQIEKLQADLRLGLKICRQIRQRSFVLVREDAPPGTELKRCVPQGCR